MFVQKSKGTADEALGSLLFCWTTVVAFLEVEDIDPETNLANVGGEQLIYDRLDARYPPKKAQDKIGEALDGLFKLRASRNAWTYRRVRRTSATDVQPCPPRRNRAS